MKVKLVEGTIMQESTPGNEDDADGNGRTTTTTDLTDKTFKSEKLFYMENWRKSENFDTSIVCCDGECSAHRLVLCHVSPFMGSLLDDQFPGQITYYSVPDVSKNVMQLLLDLAYTGTIICDTETLKDVEEAMTFLGWIRLDRMEKKVADEECIRLEAERRIKEVQGDIEARASMRSNSMQTHSKGKRRRSNFKMLVDDLSTKELNVIKSSEYNDEKKTASVESNVDATIARVIQSSLEYSNKFDSPKKNQKETKERQRGVDAPGMDESCSRRNLGPSDVAKAVELMKERSSSMPKDTEVCSSTVPKGNEERPSSIPKDNGEQGNTEDNKESQPSSRRLLRNSARSSVATIVTYQAAADPNPNNSDAGILETSSQFAKSQEESSREDNLDTIDQTMLPEHPQETAKEIDVPEQQKSGTRRKRRRKVEIMAELESTMTPRKSLRKRGTIDGDPTSESLDLQSPKKLKISPASPLPASSSDNVKATPEDMNENHSKTIAQATTMTSSVDKFANRDTGPTSKDETPRRSSRKARSVQGEISTDGDLLPSPTTDAVNTESLPNNRKSPHDVNGIHGNSLDT